MRGAEEIHGVLQTWPEGFKNRFGREVTKAELLDYLYELKKRKELKSISEQFETYHPDEIRRLIDYLNNNDVPNIADNKKTEPKKKWLGNGK